MIGLIDTRHTVDVEDFQEQLVLSLRAELEEYGALLCHFEEQQEAILHRQADKVLELSTRIEGQLDRARHARKARESVARASAEAAGFPEQTALKELVHFFRPAVRPMVEALTDEVNRLINYTRRRAQQNQMLLSRAMEVTQEVLGRLSPDTLTRTYSPGGKMRMTAGARSGRLLEQG
jgi:flagellar biosynthesis/type III secretory pathway chaperone